MIPLEPLRKSEVFEGLTDDELVAIAKIAREETYAPGAIIFCENQVATSLYVIRDGRVAILIDIGRNRQTVIETLTKGHSFGWSAMVPPFILTGTAKAVEKTRVVAIPTDELRNLCRQNCRTCYAIMEKLAMIISARLRDTRRQLVALMYS